MPPKKEIPRWKDWGKPKQKKPAAPAAVIQLTGRGARAMAREVTGAEGKPRVSRRIGSWRFRRHLHPFIWLPCLAAAGGFLHTRTHAVLWALLAAAVAGALAVLAVRARDRHGKPLVSAWARRYTDLEGAATAVWLPVLAWRGLHPCAAALLATWAPFAGFWVRRYRWRPAAPPPGVPDDKVTWAALCEQQKWNATLGRVADLPGGGRRYPVQCDGVKTVIKKILAQPDFVAGAWHSPVTEVYAERDPKGVTSRGYLTILPGNSLQETRWWDGAGMDPATGLARTGTFADGTPAHIKLYTPRFGCRHDLDSGTTGSGKSELLNLKIFIALATGWFVPVILDPQEGQSLPFWRERCIYASGVGDVGRRLRGLYAAFMDRSAMLGTLRWDDDGVDMPGMPFFDYELLQQVLGRPVPIPWIILDEAHMVLKDGSKYQRQITADVVELARLIRKAGGKMTLATHIPSLADLGGQQALRDMLRGGNVWSGRTANKVGAGMLGLVKDPAEIPRFFADGTETAGLGYTSGPDNRPDAPMRTLLVGKDHYRAPPPVPALDDRFLEVMDAAMKQAASPTSGVAPLPPAPAVPAGGGLGKLLTLPRPAPAPEAAGDGRCVDAVWAVLSEHGGEMTRGEIIKAAGDLARGQDRKPWSIKAVQNALTALAGGTDPARPVAKPRDGVYQAGGTT